MEMIPPTSHVINIDRQIEGRMVLMNLKTEEAVFQLDSTSQKKLEVFYAELTGKAADSNLSERLKELRVTMRMADLVGIELLEFHEVLGGIFESGGKCNLISIGADISVQAIEATVKEEWSEFCKSLHEYHDNYTASEDCTIPIHSDQETVADPKTPAGLAACDLFDDDDELEMFPEDDSMSPCTYWGPRMLVVPDSHLQQVNRSESDSSSPSDYQPPSSATLESVYNSLPPLGTWNRGNPNPYGGLGYVSRTRSYQVPPPTPSLVSLEDSQSPSAFSLPSPLIVASNSKTPGLKASGSRPDPSDPLLCLSSSSSLYDAECSRLNSLRCHPAYSPLDSPSGISNASPISDYSSSSPSISSQASIQSHPSIYHAFPSSAITVSRHPSGDTYDPASTMTSPRPPNRYNFATFLDFFPQNQRQVQGISTTTTVVLPNAAKSRQGLRASISDQLSGQTVLPQEVQLQPATENEEVDSDEIDVGLEDNRQKNHYVRTSARAMDLADMIMQERMRVMLEAEQKGGSLHKATRDGVDNHPILMRLRSLSGATTSQVQSIKEEVAWREKQNDTAEIMVRIDDCYVPLESVLRDLEAQMAENNKALKDKNPVVDTGTRVMSIHPAHAAGQTSDSKLGGAFHFDMAGSLTAASAPRAIKPRIESFEVKRAEAMKNAMALETIRSKFHGEGVDILGTLRQTIEQIHSLEERITDREAQEWRLLESEARAMIEYWGYDESAFTHEAEDEDVDPSGTEQSMGKLL